ncbi:MAG: aspartate carbamoyltransferase catalytic subunit, partial [Angelakisella sp.]
MKNLYNLSELSVAEISDILDQAEAFKNREIYRGAEGKTVANLFFEPSTRTHYSFQTAELNLGCKILSLQPESSSLKKGETFYDTVKTFESFGVDAIVIRHTENEYYRKLSGLSVPVLNGGDGTGNHPTQSLLDLLTIREEFDGFDGLKIAICGDISHSRVAHSNMEVMERMGMECYTSGPEEYSEPGYRHMEFDQAVQEMDIIMLLRVQSERHQSKMSLTDEEYNLRFGIHRQRLTQMKPGAIIMHPAPFNRGVEIS